MRIASKQVIASYNVQKSFLASDLASDRKESDTKKSLKDRNSQEKTGLEKSESFASVLRELL
jgi:hypothetical protein